MIKKPYPPGMKKKRRTVASSEYGKELKEKQKLKNWYVLSEQQLSNYVKEILKKRGRVEDTSALLIQKLESRLDNVIFRLGFGPSRSQTRQLVSHGHFLVNGRSINIPSYQLRKGDKISIKEKSKKKKGLENLPILLKKQQPPSWLKLDVAGLQGEVVALPDPEQTLPPAELSSIFEYYSR
jgi:small subunit ribosomal protein S4